MVSPHSVEWLAAAKKEHQSLLDLNVFHLISPGDVPPGHNIIGLRWVFKVKTEGRFKGRVVATGWSQRHGIDCESNLAPVCRIESQRLLLVSLQLMDGAWPLWIFRLHVSTGSFPKKSACGKPRCLRPELSGATAHHETLQIDLRTTAVAKSVERHH